MECFKRTGYVHGYNHRASAHPVKRFFYSGRDASNPIAQADQGRYFDQSADYSLEGLSRVDVEDGR